MEAAAEQQQRVHDEEGSIRRGPMTDRRQVDAPKQEVQTDMRAGLQTKTGSTEGPDRIPETE